MQQMKREDYKAVKHMNKEQLTAYLQRVYRRGFDAGAAAAAGLKKAAPPPAPQQTAPAVPETGT